MLETLPFLWAELLCKKRNGFTEAQQKGPEVKQKKQCVHVCNILYNEEEGGELF